MASMLITPVEKSSACTPNRGQANTAAKKASVAASEG